MLLLSTRPDNVSLMNLAGYLLQETPSKVQEAVELTGMIRTEKSSWDGCLRVANMLLDNGQINQAKELIAELDSTEYFQQAASAGQVNLLFSVLIRTDQGDVSLFLLESANMAERFSVFDNMDIKLRAANTLLARGQTDQAKGLIAEIDTAKFMKHVNSAGQVRLLFNVIAYFQRPAEIFRLLEDVKIIRLFGGEALIDLKLNIVNTLIMQGQRQAAKEILTGINPESLSNQDHAGLLGLAYIQLSMFDQASHVFGVAERKENSHPDLFTHMARLFLCLGEIDKAKDYIDKHAQSNKRSPSNLLWKAKLLNYTGQHVDALYWVDILLSNFSSFPVRRCFGFVEKGNTLRSLARFEEALFCYQKAQEIHIGATFWLWIAHFEHAMTLIYLDKTEEALTAALKGCTYKSQMYSEKYNPCVILYHFLLHRQKRSKDFLIPTMKWADNARLWPHPYTPHKVWMLLLTAVVLEEQGHTQTAKSLIGEIINSLVSKDKSQQEHLTAMLATVSFWRDYKFLNSLSSAVWPNEFNWRVIRHLVDCKL